MIYYIAASKKSQWFIRMVYFYTCKRYSLDAQSKIECDLILIVFRCHACKVDRRRQMQQ